MYANFVKARNLAYYRCSTKRASGPGVCVGKDRRADRLESEVWEKVRALLTDPVRLRDDLDAMIEIKRRGIRGDPGEEMSRWLSMLAQAEEKRARYQRAYAADVLSLADLKARLAELENECEIAEQELASLRGRAAEIERMEQERDAILDEYEGASAEALESLTPEQRHAFYKSFGLEVYAHPDGSTEIMLGNLLAAGEDVCTKGATPKRRARNRKNP